MKEQEAFEKAFVSVTTLGDYFIAFIELPSLIFKRDKCLFHQEDLAGPRLPAVMGPGS